VFETLWLTVLYWNKVTAKSLRQFLKIEDEKSNLVEIEVNDKNIQNAGEFSDDALDGKQENMMKLKEFLGVRPTIDL
jgi:capsular polysaccharide biosynthesis protein